MKSTILVLLAAVTAHAAEFSTGQAARLVIGQRTFTEENQGADQNLVGGVGGDAYAGDMLFVVDSNRIGAAPVNQRVLIFKNVSSSFPKPTDELFYDRPCPVCLGTADGVLGQKTLTTFVEPDLTKNSNDATSNNMSSPVSVTSDGVRLYVTDLGHNRVLIWNSIPTSNFAAADVVVGQPDMTSSDANNSAKLCPSNGTDSTTNTPTYPELCEKTMNFPRFALSDGRRLFVADGGNDRVLVYNAFPTQNGQSSDVILGQTDEFSDSVTDSTDTFRPDSNILRSSPNTIRTPLALAFDGTNLYVSDPFDRRILVFTPGLATVPITGITNAASRSVFAIGSIIVGGTIKAADTVTVTINAATYTYTIVAADTLATVIQNVADLINGKANATPDPNVVATPNPGFNELLLTSKVGGLD